MTVYGELDRLIGSLAEHVMESIGCDWFAATDLSGTRPLVMFEAGTVPRGGWLPAFAARLATDRQVARPLSLVRRPDLLTAELPCAELLVIAGRSGRPSSSRERFELLQLCRSADVRWRELAVRSGMNAHPSGRSGLSTHPVAAS